MSDSMYKVVQYYNFQRMGAIDYKNLTSSNNGDPDETGTYQSQDDYSHKVKEVTNND